MIICLMFGAHITQILSFISAKRENLRYAYVNTESYNYMHVRHIPKKEPEY
jgi:alpha-acetolactate decarboxylase